MTAEPGRRNPMVVRMAASPVSAEAPAGVVSLRVICRCVESAKLKSAVAVWPVGAEYSTGTAAAGPASPIARATAVTTARHAIPVTLRVIHLSPAPGGPWGWDIYRWV